MPIIHFFEYSKKWIINGKKLFDFSNNPYYINNCMGIEPRMTGSKSNTLTQEYLPDFKSMVNIKLKYITLNTTYVFTRSAIFLSGSLSRCSLFELLYPCAPHRPPQASVCHWIRSCSVLFGHLIHYSTFTLMGWLYIS